MTKGAKGRGDAAPPDLLARTIEAHRVFYERTGNPLFVWKALYWLDVLKVETRKCINEENSESPSSLYVPVPDWCWQYLSDIAMTMQLHSGISTNRPWEITKRELIEVSQPLAKEEEEAKKFLDYVKKIPDNLPAAKATKLVQSLPEILGFVDGAHSNAFLDYWRWERKALVLNAWAEARDKGLKRAEALAFVSEMTGIYDEPTIRRYVKEAQGKALPRRRSNKPKAPKGKKD
jgi:hypothetical protein